MGTESLASAHHQYFRVGSHFLKSVYKETEIRCDRILHNAFYPEFKYNIA